MSEPQIGNWVRRTGRSGQKWHLVDSVVAGDVVTRCGRRMSDSRPLQVSEVMPLTRMIGQPQLCKAGCERVDPFSDTDAVPEDGWCGNEDAHLPHDACPGSGSLAYGRPEDA